LLKKVLSTFQLPFIRFELNEAIFLPIEENRSVTASASYSVLINRIKERSSVVGGTKNVWPVFIGSMYRQAAAYIQRRGLDGNWA
jgi:hypothetical protein